MTTELDSGGRRGVKNDYRLGEWTVRPQRGCIERGGETVHLKPKVMGVLNCLAAGGGDVVKRDDLFEAVWPGQVVSDATLTQCVVELRQAFGDSAKNPRFVETIPKVGFRLVPEVEAAQEDMPDEPEDPSTENAARPRSRSTVLLAVVLVALAVYFVWHMAGDEEQPDRLPGTEDTSLAVLPFTDVSPDQQQGWIADSLTEQLINRLSRLEALDVTGKTASFSIENGQADLKAVADELGVDFILEGSVFRVDEDIRINTRLVEVGTGEIWWSYEWRPRLDQFLDMQEIITEGVSHALSINLNVGELGLDPLGPSDVEAFWSVDRAQRLVAMDTREYWVEAVREIENAVERDPSYPQAWLWASFIYGMAGWKIGDIIHRDWTSLSEHALDQALRLEPDSRNGLNLLIHLFVMKKQFGQAERIIDRVEPLESVTHADLVFRVGVARNHVGRSREAMAALERAQLLDPDDFAHFKRMLAWAYLLNGRTDEALAMYDRAWGNSDVARGNCSREGLQAALVTGDIHIIRKWLMRAQEFNERGVLRIYQAMETHLDDSLAALAFLREAFENPYEDVADHMIAFWAAYHGDHELAQAAVLREGQEWWLWYPLIAPIRNEPAVRQMMVELGLVDYWREYTWADFCEPVGESDFRCR